MWKKMPNNFALLTLYINLYGKLETKFIIFHYLNTTQHRTLEQVINNEVKHIFNILSN